MKNRAHVLLRFCTCAILAVLLLMQNFVSAGTDQAIRQSRAQLTLTTEQKSQTATDALIKYFEQMIEKNILGITGLECLAESPSVINPILPEQYHTSDLVDTFKAQLDTILEKGKDWFDLARIKTWAQAKIQELEHRERTRQRVHEETRKVHIPMRFVEIPAGKYVDIITHEEFEIPEGVEIQETPVTQWQWAEMMGENPSVFVDGTDSEHVVINREVIKLRPNTPVENVSWNDAQEFIKKLNKVSANSEYEFGLPSVQEYQAAIGKNLLKKLPRGTIRDIMNEETHSVAEGPYIELNGKRLSNIMGNVWQWTRDTVEVRDKHAHLVFGGSYATDKDHQTAINHLLFPVVYDQSINESIGLRCIRYKKALSCDRKISCYLKNQLAWDQSDCTLDPSWQWDTPTKTFLCKGDCLHWMFEHKNGYPTETQRTLECLRKEIPSWITAQVEQVSYLTKLDRIWLMRHHPNDVNLEIKDLSPLVYLTNLAELGLEGNCIQDISPLVHLTKLFYLDLHSNQIQDISPLARLSKLTGLNLSSNQIKDLSPLANLTKLTELNLRNNHIQNLDPLAHLTDLTRLFLSDNQVKDIGPLAHLAKLTVLDLDNNQVQDMSSLAYFTNLETLYCEENQVQDISPLAHLTSLRTLWLRGNKIHDVSPLAHLTKITDLRLDNNPTAGIAYY